MLFVRPQNNWVSSFLLWPVWERLKVTLWQQNIFKNTFWNGTIRYVSALRKKMFSTGSVKFCYLYALKYSNSFDIAKPNWDRTRVMAWEQKISKNNFCIAKFKYVSRLCKKYFQLHQWHFSFFSPQIFLVLKIVSFFQLC